VSERTQYMLKLDRLRLKAGGERVYDSRTVDSCRRQKGEGPFQSIEECVRFFGSMGMPIDIYRRVPSYSDEEFERLRTGGRLLLGRFQRGKVRYVLAEDAPLFVAAYRVAGLSQLDQRLLNVISSAPEGMSLRRLTSEMGVQKDELKESLDRLDRSVYIIRRYEQGEEWSRENVYLPFETERFSGDPVTEIVRRFLLAYGPVTLHAVTSYSGFGPAEVKRALSRLDVSTITVGDLHQEMYLMEDELPKLEAFSPKEEGTHIISLYDPAAQPLWAEIASRYGEGWVFPIMHQGRLVGGAEKWNMSGCIEIRSLDLDDERLLPRALEALDRMMSFYRLVGYDVVRVREVLGKEPGQVPAEVHDAMLNGGYVLTNGLYVKGRFVAKEFTRDEVVSYSFKKQRVEKSRRFPNIIEVVKATGGLRSEADAYLRSKVQVPLKRLADQGFLIRAVGIPEYTIYTTQEHASLYRRARSVEMDNDMRAIMRIIDESGSVSRRRLFDLSPVGERRTKEAMKRLYHGTCICLDGQNRWRPVRESLLSQHDARKDVVRLLFRNFGLFSAENLSRFMKFELSMRELRGILGELEDESFLVKGFLMKGDSTMHWMLASDVDKVGPITKAEVLLTPMDNLWFYLYPLVMEKFGSWCYVLFRGPDMAGMFRAYKKGKTLLVHQLEGDVDLMTIKKQLRDLGMAAVEMGQEEQPDWETEDFYELSHPGD
ncbi:MAG: crosslink repair DNA glycosylase YcaQ family protein, partial [Methanomassiliicoccales archaeon]